MLLPRDEVRSLKYFVKRQKRYAPVVRLGRRTRILRLSARTASVAIAYGQQVLARYQRWCDITLAKEMTK